MSNTVVIQAINEIQVNGGANIDPVSAINAGTCTLSEWYAALQVWSARSITAATAAATTAAQAISGPLLSAAQQAATTAQNALNTLQGQVNTFVLAGQAATDLPTLQGVLAEAAKIASPFIVSQLQAKIATHEADLAATQAQLAAMEAETPPA